MLKLDGAETLGKDIYVFHNFISDEECLDIIKDISLIEEGKWEGKFNEGGQGYEVAHFPMTQIEDINKRLIAILDKDVNLGWSSVPTRMKKGWVGPHHSDNFDFLKVVEASKLLKDGEEFDTRENSVAGLIMYFNDFQGGEIYYSNQDIYYHPKAGDLVIHSSQDHCRHQVQEVKSEIRYSHSSHLYNLVKVPKWFKDVA